MENASGVAVKTHQDKKNEFIKLLFRTDGGILNHLLAPLPKESIEDFFYEFMKTEGVQVSISTFIGDIRKQCNAAVNKFNVGVEKTMNEHENTAAEQKVVLRTPGGLVMVDESLIQPVNFGANVDSNTNKPHLPTRVDQEATFASPTVEQKPAIVPSTQSSVVPGVVPPANTPAPQPPTPNLEQTRSTFSVTANGKANVEFKGKVEGKSASGKPLIIIDVTIPPELGLSFNTSTSELTGVPLLAGEFKLTVHFQFENHVPGNPTPDGECNLIINPDPKTLWKDLPSDENEIYWKKDTDLASMSGKDGLEVIVASKRGRSHAHIGSCRDDDFRLMQDEDSGWRVISVADGAGGSKLSRKGSLIASRTATDSVLKALASERGKKLDEAIAQRDTDPSSAHKMFQDELYYLFGNAAKESVQAIETEAKANGAVYKDYSTTLIVTIHKKIAAGHFVAAYWVGDGGVGIYRKGQELKVLGKADSGEFAGQTRFLDMAMLTQQEILSRIDAKIVPDFTAVIAMTDGITDPWFETDANLENITKWDELWSDLSSVFSTNPPASGLLDWLDFWSQGNHDDRTIAVLYPSDSAVQVTPEAVA